MYWAKRQFTIAFIASVWATPVPADDTDGCPVEPASPIIRFPDKIIDTLIGWIAVSTDYDVRSTYDAPPTISFCDIGDIVEYEGKSLLVEKELQAAIDFSRRHIYLVMPWNEANLFDLSVLLHELIHDVQLANRGWECIGEPEWEAYRLQDLWLRQHGILWDFDWPAIAEISNCAASPDQPR